MLRIIKYICNQLKFNHKSKTMKRQRTFGLFGLLLAAMVMFTAMTVFRPPTTEKTVKQYSFSVSDAGTVQVTGVVVEKFTTVDAGLTYSWLTLYDKPAKAYVTIQVKETQVFNLTKRGDNLVLRCRTIVTNKDRLQPFRC